MTDYIKVTPGTKLTVPYVDFGQDIKTVVIAGYPKDKSVGYRVYNLNSYSIDFNYTIPSWMEWIKASTDCDRIIINYEGTETPNIIPSSASGSLIFNLYSNNTTQPTSTSPYMWDLTGLKLNDFYTFGMNNWVKPNDGAIISVATEKVTIFPKNIWRGELGNTVILNMDNGSPFGALSPLKVKQGDSIKVNIQQTFKYAIIDSQGIILAETINTGAWSPIDTVVEITQENADRLLIQAYPNGSPVSEVYFNDITFYTNTLTLTDNNTNNKETAFSLVVESMDAKNQLVNLESITMPQRLPGYSIRMVNADITPNNYANHLYPLLVDTTLPITGKLDYSKYKGTSLAWAYAYTTNDVAITPLDSRHISQITNDYNKLYGTDYVDIVDVWAYKDDDFSSKNTNEAITKAYIELTSDNCTSRIDEVLQWYPNCTDVYLFDDGSVTNLQYMYSNGGNNNANGTRGQVQNITFMEGYFNNLDSLSNTFTSCINLITVNNIPKSVTDFRNCFENCNKLNCQIDLSDYNIRDGRLEGTFLNNYELSYTPILPSNYIGSMGSSFRECRKLVETPIIPNGVTNMDNTFNGCSALTTAPNIPDSVTSMSGTFQSCSSLTTTPNIPSGVTNMFGTFYGCASLTTAPTIPNSVTNMETTFRGCTALTTAPNIPNSVTTIKNTFNGCTSLTTVPNIGDGVTNMESTFQSCSSLTTVPNIPNSVTNMNSTFYGCTSLVEGAILHENITNIQTIYSGCTSLKKVYIPLSANWISLNRPLNDCRSLEEVIWVGNRNTSYDVYDLINSNYILLPRQSINDLVPEHLATVESATLTLGETYLAYLTEDEITSAVAKGWTLQ